MWPFWFWRRSRKLDCIHAAITQLTLKVDTLMSIETDLVAAVTNISNAVQSAIDDIRLLSGQIAGAAGDQALIADATAKLNTLAVNLQAAVSVNAPPAPSPTP